MAYKKGGGRTKGAKNLDKESEGDIKAYYSAAYNRKLTAEQIKRNLKLKLSLSKIRGLMREARNKWDDPRLELFSLASVSNPKLTAFFPPDLIPTLLKMLIYVPSTSKLPVLNERITIWTAIWVVRLCKLPEFHEGWIDIAQWYATYEQSCELAGIPCDSSRFDAPTLEAIDNNFRTYFKSRENIFATPAGRTAYADQRHAENSIMTQMVIEKDHIEGKTLKKGKRPNDYSLELKNKAKQINLEIGVDVEKQILDNIKQHEIKKRPGKK
jgi:hypothetical protein